MKIKIKKKSFSNKVFQWKHILSYKRHKLNEKEYNFNIKNKKFETNMTRFYIFIIDSMKPAVTFFSKVPKICKKVYDDDDDDDDDDDNNNNNNKYFGNLHFIEKLHSMKKL